MNEKRPSTKLGRAHDHLTLMATPAPAVRLVKPPEPHHATKRHQHELTALFAALEAEREGFFWGCLFGVGIGVLLAIVLG